MLPNYRINNQITAPELRVIDEAEQNIGVLSLADALKMAKEKGFDLIEVVPEAKPPVARIISFDKFRYQQEKKIKKQKAAQKNTGGNKQVQISIREAKNDLIMKANRVNEFLGEGNHVEVLLQLRGREKGNRDFARKKVMEFLTMITPNHTVIGGPSNGMSGISTLLAKK
jgi:translation initiation factor IF-3